MRWKQGDKLVRLGGLRVLRIGEDVFANGERINSPHRPALEALASHIVLQGEMFGDALDDPLSSRCSPRWSTAVTGSSKINT